MRQLRIFGSHLTPGAKRVYGAVIVFYLLAAASVSWPVYPLVATARPLVFGLPLSLFSLICLVVASFLVQWLLFRWERRRNALEPPDIESGEDECRPG